MPETTVFVIIRIEEINIIVLIKLSRLIDEGTEIQLLTNGTFMTSS